jgi:hypothetical protein
LEEIVATLLEALHTDGSSRSSLWRILQDVDLKPHKSVSWLNSPGGLDVKAHYRQRYAKALGVLPANRLLICCDEKTGLQGSNAKLPTKPAQPGRRERREHAYIRHGTRRSILWQPPARLPDLGSPQGYRFRGHLKQA